MRLPRRICSSRRREWGLLRRQAREGPKVLAARGRESSVRGETHVTWRVSSSGGTVEVVTRKVKEKEIFQKECEQVSKVIIFQGQRKAIASSS